MNETQINRLKEAIRCCEEENYRICHYHLLNLINELEKPCTYIVYVDCRTFKSGIPTIQEARDWQTTLGGKVYKEI